LHKGFGTTFLCKSFFLYLAGDAPEILRTGRRLPPPVRTSLPTCNLRESGVELCQTPQKNNVISTENAGLPA